MRKIVGYIIQGFLFLLAVPALMCVGVALIFLWDVLRELEEYQISSIDI